ncbi:hydroxyacid dehydrogenase [Mycolicibacterium thermoresistibile]|uniref:Phosphoglycerate dehydrogenase-like oxidoreductase n=2 Tax=Mycolicibacterium thermoresistibile TaxID=1797 RepID=A0A117IML0_MYCTH|nr:hydroxyacid dehydrogenase [Mycolicibacterium thermoresistibile]EHI10518.1 putative D-3-phosphoglycerate dehydrogenase (PGDH) [Mycolicibacterium thermoresistibile ATCC 19527]MCV7189656.1 hydroxyacid dehydrogenase [Mycolicibacterium thermoresistibile]GAT15430.1 phosphoglycerate dehydrogenase-like oxidoreductase [Mycolicibacterium thermoresistibile]SNW17489.1 phosphoglycerate dehydrogenase-like oxidoreductase [Mycolicibacterium thermoresistibile]
MSGISRPRLVFERWTDPAAGELLGAADIELVRLDLTADPADGWAALESAHGYQVATRTDVASMADGGQWLADRNLVRRCGLLLAVCSAGAGYDVIDVDACTEAGIAVCNNSGPGAEAVAEHALGLMLDLAKRITVADRMLRRGDLGDRLVLRGSQLQHKTMGIVGLGAIGRRLVQLVAPFGMKVLAFDPYVDEKTAEALGARSVSLEELLGCSDFVQLTCPLTAETEGLIGRAQFAAMKPTAFFVTTARGRVHDEAALYEALTCGEIAGAGLDVFHDEPPRADHPLLTLDNVVATPHIAGITAEAARDIAVATADQWQTIFAGGVPPRLLNPEVWPRYSARFAEIFGFAPEPVSRTREREAVGR